MSRVSRWLLRGHGRGNKTVEEIASYVSIGHAQSAANCRVLLNEIDSLRSANEKLERDMLELLNRDIERGEFVPFPRDLYERLVKLTRDTKIDRDNDVIDGDVGL